MVAEKDTEARNFKVMAINFTQKEVLKNHAKYLERKNLYSLFGCDIDDERTFILKQAGDLSGSRILEAGTGKGYFSMVLAKNGYHFVSFDISEEEIRFAKMNLIYYKLEKFVDLRIENMEKLSFPDRMFDVIFSINTLHHLTNIESSLNEITRVLSSRGKIILSDFTEQGFDLIDKIQSLEGKTHDRGHTDFNSIRNCFIKKGFEITESKSAYQLVVRADRK